MLDLKMVTAPTTFVDLYSRQTGCDNEVAHNDFLELAKFLAICGESAEPCAPSADLDEMWHCFLLCTREYSSFCQAHFGKFIHHEPQVRRDALTYARTRRKAEEKYGSLDPRLWPLEVMSAADCCSACTAS